MSVMYIKISILLLTFSRHILRKKQLPLEAVFIIVFSKFPHYWVFPIDSHTCGIANLRAGFQRSVFLFKHVVILMELFDV